MPNRIIRDAILTSEAVCGLGWPEEVFYRRLMSIVDDYGRHEANPQLLRSRCYPLQTDQVRVADITRWMAACQKSGVILVYEIAGKQYLELQKFGQQQRSPSKCPPPPALASKCAQTLANEHLDVVVSVSVENPSSASPTGVFDTFWEAYPRKVGKDAARKAFEKRKPDSALLSRMLSAIRQQASSEQWRKDGGQFIPHPATWLNEGRFDDGGVHLPEPVNTQAESTARLIAEQRSHERTAPPPELLARVRSVRSAA